MAYIFDGNGDKIAFDTNSTQEGKTQYSFHIRAWRESGGGQFGYGQMFHWHSSTPTAKFWFENDNGNAGWGIVFKVDWSSSDGAWSIAYPTNQVWYDYVITYDGSSTANDPIIYKDGVSQTITERLSPGGTFPTTQTTLGIGNYSGTDLSWNGRLAEMAIWDRILSADEAAQLGNGYSPLFIPRGLVFYAPMIRDLNDIRTGITGTLTNAVNTEHPKIIYPSMSQILKLSQTVVPPAQAQIFTRMLRGVGY